MLYLHGESTYNLVGETKTKFSQEMALLFAGSLLLKSIIEIIHLIMPEILCFDQQHPIPDSKDAHIVENCFDCNKSIQNIVIPQSLQWCQDWFGHGLGCYGNISQGQMLRLECNLNVHPAIAQ